jgi:diguanylate cyclase (GGDEF)-like protein
MTFVLKISTMFLLLVGISFYAIFQQEKILSLVTENKRHIQITTSANELSSYAKRVEGHVFLYLMFAQPRDKEKVFQRIASLKKNATQLQQLLNTEQSEIAKQLYEDIQNFVSAGENIITQFDNNSSKNSVAILSDAENIQEFHLLSSNIRKSGVILVKQSANILHEHIQNTRYRMGIEQMRIAYFILFGLILLLIILVQSRKLFRISKKLHVLSYTDELTGVANRRAYQQTFSQEWKRALRKKTALSLLIIDIDCFKEFNDLYGHAAGDQCLSAVAQAIQSCIKRPGDQVSRYGGEEFVAILPDTSNAKSIAEACRLIVEQLNIAHKDSTVSTVITVTIGFGTIKPNDNLSPEEMFEKVDQALYKGKQSGRNQIQSI